MNVVYDMTHREELEAVRLERRAHSREIELANNYCRFCSGSGIVAAITFENIDGWAVCKMVKPTQLLPCVCLTGFPLYVDRESYGMG